MSSTGYTTITANSPSPLDDKSTVDTLANLIARDTRWFWTNMLVWVSSEKKFYYKKDGAVGNQLIDWQALETTNVKFIPYDNGTPYLLGSCVSVGTAMYISTANTSAGEDPINVPSKWLSVGGAKFYEMVFVAQTSLTITHSIERPIFSLWDNLGNPFMANIQRTGAGTATITFSKPRTGKLEVK